MTQPVDLDRRLATWLANEAPVGTPEGLLERSLVRVGRTRRQPTWLTVVRGTAMGRGATSPRLAYTLVVIGLLVAAFAAVLAVGPGSRNVLPPPPTPVPSWDSSLAPVFGLPGRFAFARDRGDDFDIYTMNPDRTELRQLTNLPGDDVSPLWSPDGQRIVFMSSRGGDPRIYVMDADGTHATLLVDGSGDDLLGAWSPDGTRVAYTDGTGTVHIIGIDGTGDRKVEIRSSSVAVGGMGVFDWTPDGAELVIGFDTSPEGGDLQIYRLAIADGGLTPLGTSPVDDGTPALSADGSRIAFQSDRDGGCLFVMAADGSNVARLTTGCSKGFPKSWSPDGMWIGWAGARRVDHDQPWNISVIRGDGSGRTELTDSRDIVDLDWGPSP